MKHGKKREISVKTSIPVKWYHGKERKSETAQNRKRGVQEQELTLESQEPGFVWVFSGRQFRLFPA